jgi:tetratricopeptide (TPR) repeat protein
MRSCAAACLSLLAMSVSARAADDQEPAEAAAAPAAAATDESGDDQIAKLIRQLGDQRFAVREAAQQELARLGFEAFEALTEAENDADIEVASRARYLVRLMRFEFARPDDPPEVKQALQEYESLDAAGRLDRIRRLATQMDEPHLSALCRLVRFEKSQTLSKRAALAVMQQKPGALPADRRAEIIRKSLGKSPRPAAAWLRTYLDVEAQTADALARFADQVTAEEQLLTDAADRTQPDIVISLLWVEADLLDRLARADESVAVMERIAALEPGDTSSLFTLLDRLSDRQAWTVIDGLATRLAERFNQEAVLGYALAAARRKQGDESRAKESADRAFGLNANEANAHLEIAQHLQRQGASDWSEREFRHVIQLGPPEGINAIYAGTLLADLLHDKGDDEGAAQVLETTLASLAKANQAGGDAVDPRGFLSKHINTRFNYYRACHLATAPDEAQQLAHLLEAAKHDPQDADVLIALHRLQNLSPEQRQQTEAWIATAAAEFRRQIAENPGDPLPYNQLAWLLSNTDRDQQEALKCSLESLKLRPDSAGFMDTLARCYFSLQDYDRAVEWQTKAVAGEPHSGLMKRQLELFQKTLAEKQSEASGDKS